MQSEQSPVSYLSVVQRFIFTVQLIRSISKNFLPSFHISSVIYHFKYQYDADNIKKTRQSLKARIRLGRTNLISEEQF